MLRYILTICALALTVGCAADQSEDAASQNWPDDLQPAQVQGMWLAPSGSDDEILLLWLKPDGSWVRAQANGKFANLSTVEYVERGRPWEVDNAAANLATQPEISAGEYQYPVAKVSKGELHLGPWMDSVVYSTRYVRAWPSVEKRVSHLLAVHDQAVADGRDPTQAQIRSDNSRASDPNDPRVTVSGGSDTGVGVSVDFGGREGP